MQHPDEHILSAYALGSLDRTRERSVQKHLRECEGCRVQVDELLSMYRFTEDRLVEREAVGAASPFDALAPVYRSLSKEKFDRPLRLSARVGGGVQWFVDMARRRPLVTGAGTLTFGMIAFLAVNLVHTRVMKEPEPAFTRINATHSAIDVYDRDNVRLWEIPFQWNMGVDGTLDASREMLFTEASMCLGNGKTQVLTVTPFQDEGRIVRNALRAYDNRGGLLWTKHFGRNITFRGEQYLSYFGMKSLVTFASTLRPGTREILVGALDDRSPGLIVRVGADSATLGEYWHFGHLPHMVAGTLAGEPRKVLLLFGINDLADRVDSSFPAIAVLDPSRITGRTESSVTPGYGYPASEAELFYIRADQPRLPILASATAGKNGFSVLKVGQDSTFTFVSKSGAADGFPNIFYTFDSHMRLLDVLLEDTSRRILTEQIFGSKAAVDAYVKQLRNSVRYWDGSAWHSEWTPVRHYHLPA
jgi:hypothetical protein